MEKAKEKYGDKFDFPNIESEYINNKAPITIRCSTCGYTFEKRPNDFLNDKVFRGCKQCRMKPNKQRKPRAVTVTYDKYIERFKSKFGDTIKPYEEDYVNTQKPIRYKCNVCGKVYKMRPHNALASDGCPFCNKVANKKLTTDEFIRRANEVHDNKYDYSESVYTSTDTKIKVICHEKDKFGDEHGAFYVTPHAHIGSMRSGCPKCSGKFRKDTDYFIKEAILVHGDKYDYSNTKYESALKKVEISCPTHGLFFQSPNCHLSGKGCPKCNESALERQVRTLLEKHGIRYEYQKKFDWLGKQSLDFYIPSKNIAIECQGVQHFSLDMFWKRNIDKETMLKLIQDRDKRKKELCKEHGVEVIYFSNLGIDYPYEVIEDEKKLLEKLE